MPLKLLNLLPNEEKFYTLLSSLTKEAETASHALHHLLEAQTNGDDALASQCVAQTVRAKDQAKKGYHAITREVCRTFITPFDREDIEELATAIYLVPKSIAKVVTRLERHGARSRDGDLEAFSKVIARQATALTELMHALVKGLQPDLVNEKAAILLELEDEGDEAFSNQVYALLTTDNSDVRDLLLRKDLYEALEDVTDYFRDAASVALRIVLKHS